MSKTPPLNDCLNNTKQRWGLSFGATMATVAIAALVGWWQSALLGVAIAVGVPILSWTFTSIDPQIYRLAALSLSEKKVYDQRRRRR